MSRTSWLGAVLLGAMLAAAGPKPAAAVPIFAERYGFKCSQCHTAVPELNPFGEHFRRAGFRLPNVPQQKDLPVALRLQETYVKELLPSQPRRFNALAVLISSANFGRDDTYSYFARYLFGSQGAAGSLYYAFAQHVNPSSGVFETAGLFDLPLVQHPTQRLDTVTTPVAYSYFVGHSVANFATPRWGAMFGQRDDLRDIEVALSLDEYHGAAYGAPAPPSDFAQSFAGPEIFATANFALNPHLHAGALVLDGARDFRSRTTSLAYRDRYYREGVEAELSAARFDVAAQQLWGRDANGDGFGNAIGSSGGFVTFKYRPVHNAYVGVRYDAAADPFATRDFAFYAAFAPTIHSRFVIERVQPLGTHGAGTTSAQLLFALPFEKAK